MHLRESQRPCAWCSYGEAGAAWQKGGCRTILDASVTRTMPRLAKLSAFLTLWLAGGAAVSWCLKWIVQFVDITVDGCLLPCRYLVGQPSAAPSSWTPSTFIDHEVWQSCDTLP